MKYKLEARFFEQDEGLANTLTFWTPLEKFRIFTPLRVRNSEEFKDHSRYLYGDYEQRFVAFRSPEELSPNKKQRKVKSITIDEGELSVGAHRTNQREYFIPDSNWIDGRHSFIMLSIDDVKDSMTETDEVLLEDSEYVWFYMTHRYQVPYIFTSRSDYEPINYSALPLSIEEDLLEQDLAFWMPDSEVTLEEAKEYVMENWTFEDRAKFEFDIKPWRKNEKKD